MDIITIFFIAITVIPFASGILGGIFENWIERKIRKEKQKWMKKN